MDQIKIGNFLKELRKGKGLTQEQLAEEFNVSGKTVSRWENGNNMPDISILVELSEFYGVDIREIIDGERKNDDVNEEINDTLEKVANYTDINKEAIINKLRNNSIIAAIAIAAAYIIEVYGLSQGYGILFFVQCLILFLALVFVGESVTYATGKKSELRKNGGKRLSKALKIALVTLSIVLALGIAAGGYFLYASQLRFICIDSDQQTSWWWGEIFLMPSGMIYPGGMSMEEMQEYSKWLKEEGYYTSAPVFRSDTNYGTAKYRDVYMSLMNDYIPYLYDMCEKYENRVRIDYTADIDNKNKRITVAFTGFGYPENGEPEVLDRDYIFDISNVDEDNMPVLLTQYTYGERVSKIFDI